MSVPTVKTADVVMLLLEVWQGFRVHAGFRAAGKAVLPIDEAFPAVEKLDMEPPTPHAAGNAACLNRRGISAVAKLDMEAPTPFAAVNVASLM